MQKIISVLVISLMLCVNVFGKVIVNDKIIKSEVKNGTTMISIRDLSQALGGQFAYEEDVITFVCENDVLAFQFGKDIAIKTNIDDVMSGVALTNRQYLMLPYKPYISNGVSFVPLKVISDSLKLNTNITSNSDISIVKNTTTSSLNTKNSIPIIDNEKGVEQYLSNKYSVVSTDIGPIQMSFSVVEFNSRTIPNDYALSVKLDSTAYYELMYGRKYSSTAVSNSKKQLKAHMKALAEDLTQTFPGRKFEGSYNHGYYRYEYIQMDWIRRSYCSWKNHEGDIMQNYDEADICGFTWDTKWDEEQW